MLRRRRVATDDPRRHLPWAIGDQQLGDDVLDVGPGYGATTDVLSTAVAQLTSVEVDAELAAMPADRFAATPSVRIVNADATTGIPGRPLHRRSLFHDAASRRTGRTPEPAVRRDRAGAALRCRARGSLASEPLQQMHDGDTYNPIDPATLPARLTAAGFTDVEVRVNELGWSAVARKG